MCKKELGTDVDSLLERIAKLEDALAGNVDMARSGNRETKLESKLKPADRNDNYKPQVKNDTEPEVKSVSKPKEEATVDKQPSFSISLKEVSERWPKVLDAVRRGSNIIFWSNVKTASLVSVSNGVLSIGFEHAINKSSVEEPENRKVLESSIASVCGGNLKVKCVLQDEVAADKHKDDDDIVRKAVSVFGEDLVEVEE
jgi:DNA polymerase-3 subunit gamma/tau